MSKPSRTPLVVGLLLVAAGWAVLFVAWYQTGQQDLETGQLPYMLSGGFGAFGLFAVGGVLVLIDFVRQSEWRAHLRVDELIEAISALGVLLGRPRSAERERDAGSELRHREPGRQPKRRPRRRGGGSSRGGVTSTS